MLFCGRRKIWLRKIYGSVMKLLLLALHHWSRRKTVAHHCLNLQHKLASDIFFNTFCIGFYWLWQMFVGCSIIFSVTRKVHCLPDASLERLIFFSFVHFLMFIGCLQSIYGIHTFRVESIARGKAAPVDELQVQGVDNPVLLRKVNQVSFLLVYCLCKLWTLKAFFAHTIMVDFLFPSGHCNRGCKGHT